MIKGESLLKTKKNQKMEQGGKKAVEKLWKTTPLFQKRPKSAQFCGTYKVSC
jgi:hypothetical protein